MVTYRSSEVVRLTGCTYRQLDYWCRRGIIPGHGEADGSGSRRTFTAAHVDLIGRLTREAAHRRRPLVDVV